VIPGVQVAREHHRAAASANLRMDQPVRCSIQRLTASAANTMGQLRFDRVAPGMVDGLARRSLLAIRNDFSIWNSWVVGADHELAVMGVPSRQARRLVT
jgi:hypothetical protein